MRFGILSVLTALYFSAVCVVATTCTPESQPNPLNLPNGVDIGGTINGTLAIVLITLDEAQKIVGDKYKIQKEAFKEIVPAMPEDAYPAIVQAVIHHDVRAKGQKVSDFTSVSIEYPFLSIPDAPASSLFRLVKKQLITASNDGAIKKATSYGTKVIPATFDPPCDPYAYTRDGNANDKKVFLQGFKKDDSASVGTLFDSKWEMVPSSDSKMPWPVDLFFNITNQPSFTDPAKGCDVYARDFKTKGSKGQWSPVVVNGYVDMAGDLYNGGDGKKWEDVWGIQVDTVFIEADPAPCSEF